MVISLSLKERVLHKLTSSDLVRTVYGRSLVMPVVGPVLQKLAHTVVPRSRLWIRIPRGLGKGFWMYADPRSELGYTCGDHEPWLQELLRSELRDGDCFYDVGAHSGFFSMIAARIVGPSGTVIALEPDPRNVAVLRANIEQNHLTQVMVIQAAVWSEAGEVAFESESEELNGTKGHILSGENRSTTTMVPAVRLDDLVFEQGRRAPDLIKMDVEGAEWSALRATRRVLNEFKPKLFCKVHDPGQMGLLREYFEQFGYMVKDWKPVHEHYSDYRQLYIWAVSARPAGSLPHPPSEHRH